ncbi:MAG TPA: DEAD/DEAH box helicase [Flavisolibacter sp.]|nr:DEAD/DEAH box helicase [Flavisolibacter sp.]
MNTGQVDIPQILSFLKIKELNEMQLAVLEANKHDQDIILLSDTGSGKTLGFLLPLLEMMEPGNKSTQAIVVVPSRELALQIEQVFRSMVTGYKVTCCYGGHKREIEENSLLEAPALIIGTPGRLGDHIRRGNIQTDTVKTLILDEFDKSLELGFQEEVSFIIESLKGIKKRILTSATEAVEIPDFLTLNDPQRISFLTGKKLEALAIKMVKSKEVDKLESLFQLICFLGDRPAIIFCNHRDAVERTSAYLKDMGIVNVFYHGAMEQRDRETALAKFRNGTSYILVTTDLASRGLDIPFIRYIIHYHLPSNEETFTHRNGRTARMDASGTAILIIGPDEKLPSYAGDDAETLELPEEVVVPDKPKWSTLYIAAGKKDKVNKVDIVGFLTNKGQLKKEEIGLIEVKDFSSFVALRKSKVSQTLQVIKDEKLKGKKIKIDIVK